MTIVPPPTNEESIFEALAEAPIATKPGKMPLAPLLAVWHVLRGREIDHYPRVTVDGKPAWLDTDTMMREFAEATSHWSKLPNIKKLDRDLLDDAIKLARQSLDEVKDQTEYQDQKATRLLTITTFLTAFSGVLFTRMLDAYPGDSFETQPYYAKFLLGLSYVLFAAFVLSAVFGALITFHATRTRFKYAHDNDISHDDKTPRSRLFYRGILYVRPKAWALSFVEPHPAPNSLVDPVLNRHLKQLYLRDLVGETYLIAAKAADKLRYLDPAQHLLARSLFCLFFWLLTLSAVALIVPTPISKPTIIQLAPPSGVIPVTPTLAETTSRKNPPSTLVTGDNGRIGTVPPVGLNPLAASSSPQPITTPKISAIGVSRVPEQNATTTSIAAGNTPLVNGTAP